MGHDLYDVIRAAVNCAPLSPPFFPPSSPSLFARADMNSGLN